MSDWTPTSVLAKIVHFAGFDYDPDQDIIYSRMDATQRYFGYAYGYDRSAMAMSAAIDCEPIFFDYDNKTWMIELWKGQYGVETGCEIGVYVRDHNLYPPKSILFPLLDKTLGDRPHDSTSNHNQFFECAGDHQLLNMKLELYRKKDNSDDYELLFTRGPENHWWLTGFKWGVYSNPEDLKVSAKISFPNSTMQSAFVGALRRMGYTPAIRGLDVYFVYGTPKTQPQPRYDRDSIPLIGSLVPGLQELTLDAVNTANQNIVKAYQEMYKTCQLESNDPNDIPNHVVDTFAPYFTSYLGLLSGIKDHILDIKNIIDWSKKAGAEIVHWIVSHIASDYSTTVEIINNQPGAKTMVLERSDADEGYFLVHPAQSIPPGGRTRFKVKDNAGAHGSRAWVKYRFLNDNGTLSEPVVFFFGCPASEFLSSNDNYAKIENQNPNQPFKYATNVNDRAWYEDDIERGGHPLFVRYYHHKEDGWLKHENWPDE